MMTAYVGLWLFWHVICVMFAIKRKMWKTDFDDYAGLDYTIFIGVLSGPLGWIWLVLMAMWENA